MVTYINCSSYAWQNKSPFPLSSCSLKRPGISRCPCRLLSCLAISLVRSLKVLKSLVRLPWKCLQSQYLIGSPWKSCSWKSWSPFLLRSCFVLASPSGFIACLAVAPFWQRLQRFSLIVRLHDLLWCWYLDPVVVSLLTDCQENIFSSFIHLLSYLSSQLFLSLSGYHPMDHQIADSHPSSTCPPSVKCQRSVSWLPRPRRMSRAGSLNKGATNLLPRTKIPMSAVNQMTSLGEGELHRSFAEASRVGGEQSWR